ncbi:uncharacterized protein LOC112092219 [Morus notabilis]|uniref:uncharacterized protein LOC112092219 n=1 Tax=Morus notabilis TaxID=981085 RepID=UPI000CED7BBA|nr:uncharacterized protein LOC112092219 [Morus notabilis]
MVDGRLSRILKWEARRVSLVEVGQIDDLMQSGEGMVVPILYPTEEELSSMSVRLYLSYADQEDAEIDQLESFLNSGARMVHVQQPKPPKQLSQQQQQFPQQQQQQE